MDAAPAFQPTLPARGATRIRGLHAVAGHDFNPRSPHGERPCALRVRVVLSQFQPTLPARGATGGARERAAAPTDFNPRSPHGERQPRLTMARRHGPISTHAPRTGSDWCNPPYGRQIGISTHAPRTGSDKRRLRARFPKQHFNPRSPHGERPCAAAVFLVDFSFQPTLPARGATLRRFDKLVDGRISTHAPRTGSDRRRNRPVQG